MHVSQLHEYWIKENAMVINLNFFDDPDFMQASLLAGAVIMAFSEGIISYNAGHNFRTWPIDIKDTHFETSSALYVYARLDRSETNSRALIVYDPEYRDIEGRIITGSNEPAGEPTEEFFYILLGRISGSMDENGNQVPRTWIEPIRYGTLRTDLYTTEHLDSRYVHKEFFEKIFAFHEKDGSVIPVNDRNREVDNIEALLGLWTDYYLSAKGLNPGTDGSGGEGGATTLGGLNNVGSWADEVPSADRIMVQLAGATHWTSKPLSEVVGLDTAALADYLTRNNYAKKSDIPSLSGYATESWVNTKLSGYATSASLEAVSARLDNFLTGTDTDNIINKWKELEAFLAGYKETDTLAGALSLKADKATTLSGYGITDAYTKEEVNSALSTALSGKVDVSFLGRVFGFIGDDGNEISINSMDAVISSIKAKFGLWTDEYLSAKGLNPGSGGSSAASALYQLNDVSPNADGTGVLGASAGKVLTFGSDGKWYAADAAGGLDIDAMWDALAVSDASKKIDVSHLPDLGGSYVTLDTSQTITGKKTFTDICLSGQPENFNMPYFLGIDAYADGGAVKYITASRVAAAIGVLTSDESKALFVTLGTSQTITGAKTFDNDIFISESTWNTTRNIRFLEGGSETYGAFIKYTANDELVLGTRGGSYDDIDAMSIDRGLKRVKFHGGIYVEGRVNGNGDDEGIVVGRASNNYAALTLGDPLGIHSTFYLSPDNRAIWRYNNGSVNFDIEHPYKNGTIALTSDLSAYVQKSGDTMTGSLNTKDFVSGTDGGGLYIQGISQLGVRIQYRKADNSYDILKLTNGSITFNDNTLWHAGNDGSGSGLDADLLDGYHRNNMFSSYQDIMSTWGKTNTITVNGDKDTYYPVVIGVPYRKEWCSRISVWKNLGSPTADYPGNHSSGTSSMWLMYEGRNNCWDGNQGFYRTVYQRIEYADLVSKTEAPGGVKGDLVVYLRGGGTEYNITTDYDTSSVNVYYSDTNFDSTYGWWVRPVTTIGNRGVLNTFYTPIQIEHHTFWGQGYSGLNDVDGMLQVHHQGNYGLELRSTDSGESSIGYKALGGERFVAGAYPGRYFIWNETTGELASFLSNGNVGIGNTNPIYKLDVNGSVSIGTNNTLHLFASAGNTTEIRFDVADSDFARILSGGSSNAGYLEIATADDGTEPIYVRQYSGVFTSVVRTLTLLDENGNTNIPNVLYAGVGIWTDGYLSAKGQNTSDARLKEDINDFSGTSIIKSLRPVSFKWNALARQNSKVFDTDDVQYGLIAQEVMRVAPWAAVDDMFGDGYMGVRYEKFIPALIKSQIETIDEISDLKRRLTDVERENGELRREIQMLKAA